MKRQLGFLKEARKDMMEVKPDFLRTATLILLALIRFYNNPRYQKIDWSSGMITILWVMRIKIDEFFKSITNTETEAGFYYYEDNGFTGTLKIYLSDFVYTIRVRENDKGNGPLNIRMGKLTREEDNLQVLDATYMYLYEINTTRI